MNIEHLVEMANDVGNFFSAESDHTVAVNGIATHLRKFWEKRMRLAIIEHEKAGGAGMKELVREAVRSLAA